MKFLVLGTPRGHWSDLADPLKTYQAGKQYLEKSISEGRMDLAYTLMDGGGVIIVNADSAEELWDELHDNPLFSQFDFTFEALVPIEHSFGRLFKELAGE